MHLLSRTLAVGLIAAVMACTSRSEPVVDIAKGRPTHVPMALPAGAPPALYASEPVPPTPSLWPFPDVFPRTSGFGRLAGGAFFWSSFLYDDHGAIGITVSQQPIIFSPQIGTYIYPPGIESPIAWLPNLITVNGSLNEADIAAAAIGLDEHSAYFRVDWETLVHPNVPIAMWAFDTDDDPATGAATWPGGAGIQSAGVERWLVVSGRGAWLISADGSSVSVPTLGGAFSTDLASQSMVVRVPREALAGLTKWRVRLAAGISNATGDGFAPVTPDLGALPGQPAVYDVTFRTDAQEPLGRDNWWRDKQQAIALATNDVSAFSVLVDWSQLARKDNSPEPMPLGWTNRWYFSSIELGPGISPNSDYWASDFRPNYLGRRQPYAAYVPHGIDSAVAAPLTMLLHSINVSHNQFAIWNPTFIQNLCEARRSICAAPLGRGPDLWWADEAELDMWEVWSRMALAYRLDPSRTVLVGYSMGGYGTYRLGLEHPDLFAAIVVLASAPACSVRIVEGVEFSAVSGNRECDQEANTSPLIENARELPFYIGHDALDELAPVSSAIEEADRLDALGYRYRFEIYLHQDHVAWSNTGTFEGVTTWLQGGERQVAADPSHITYSWYAQHQRTDLGTGPSAVWWVSGLKAASNTPGFRGRIDITSMALPSGMPAIVRTANEPVVNDDGPAIATELTWGRPPSMPDRQPRLQAQLNGAAGVTIDIARAGIEPRETATADVTSDGTVVLELTGLRPGTTVITSDGRLTVADRLGRASVTLYAGQTQLKIG